MNPNTTLTPLRLAILGLVDMHPQSGYDLKKVFEPSNELDKEFFPGLPVTKEQHKALATGVDQADLAAFHLGEGK